MLILTRKLGQIISIGRDIKIYVVEIKRNQVRIGIEAPVDTIVHRQEVYDKIEKENLQAVQDFAKSDLGIIKNDVLEKLNNDKNFNSKSVTLHEFSNKEENET